MKSNTKIQTDAERERKTAQARAELLTLMLMSFCVKCAQTATGRRIGALTNGGSRR